MPPLSLWFELSELEVHDALCHGRYIRLVGAGLHLLGEVVHLLAADFVHGLQLAEHIAEALSLLRENQFILEACALCLLSAADGDARQNMISVSDITSGETFNKDLPVEPTVVRVGNEGGLNVETSRMMSPIH